MTSTSEHRPAAHWALRATWAAVAIAAGPVVIVAELFHGFGAIGIPNAHPWAEPLALVAMLASFGAGIGAIALGGRWWTAILVASPAICRVLMYSGGDKWALFALLATPIIAPLGVVLAMTPRRDDEDDDADADRQDQADDAPGATPGAPAS
ncbi:hypothetical protein ACFQ58_11045 [Agromyces sp. NPDC056523]|uniref:hypothetical protein n=1 Tax=Agromyces sp. NPDC056523 TaxID=3345850 RepID=UPI0036723DD4